MPLTNSEIPFSQLICSFIILNLPPIREKANPHFSFLFNLTSLKLCWYCLNNIVWISYSFYRTPFNWLLVNLAIADITFAVFQVPNRILTFTHPDGTIGSALCKVLTAGNVAWVGAAAGTITLVVIAFERYYTVRCPVSGKGKLTKNTVKVTEYKCDHNITVLKSSSEVYSLWVWAPPSEKEMPMNRQEAKV